MKLIEGQTLSDELKNPELSRLLGIFEQICQTVGFAHSRGIVHRDLKPSNVMIGAFGEVQVMDWGLAKQINSERSGGSDRPELAALTLRGILETVGGDVKGTPAYMAPEQARGDPVDTRTDVFSLGGILTVILTGRPPFLGGTVQDTVLKASRAELHDCFTRLEACDLDPELVALAKFCLAEQPDSRPADAIEVAKAVANLRAAADDRARQAVLDRLKADGARATAEAESREQRKRRKVQLALACAVGLLFFSGGAFAWWRANLVSAQRTADLQRQVEEQRRTADEKTRAADEKLLMTGRALLSPIVARQHFKGDVLDAMDEFRRRSEELWPERLKRYNYSIIGLDPRYPERSATIEDMPTILRFQNDSRLNEETRRVPEENVFYYYGAVRAQPSCMVCHSDKMKVGEKIAIPDLQQDDVMVVIKVHMPID